jgi:hypothetical protein
MYFYLLLIKHFIFDLRLYILLEPTFGGSFCPGKPASK